MLPLTNHYPDQVRTWNGISRLLNLKHFWGSMPPDPPSDWRLRRASCLPPRTQISSYGHDLPPAPAILHTVTSSKVPICHARDRIDLVTSLLMVGLPLGDSWSVFQGHPISQRDSNESFRLQHPVLDGSQSWQSRMIQSDMLATSSGCVCLPSMPSPG